MVQSTNADWKTYKDHQLAGMLASSYQIVNVLLEIGLTLDHVQQLAMIAVAESEQCYKSEAVKMGPQINVQMLEWKDWFPVLLYPHVQRNLEIGRPSEHANQQVKMRAVAMELQDRLELVLMEPWNAAR